MHIILGATGHVGSAVANTLLAQGERITVIARTPAKAEVFRQKGAEVAITDVHDVRALQQVFSHGKRLFLLNPPADPSADTVAEERKTIASILAAINGSGIEKIVALSTYGAQPGEEVGDLGVLYEMEQGLAAQPIPTTVLRAAYYMSNWDFSWQTAAQEGKVYTLYPVDFKLPMVAPQDIGRLAARLMLEPTDQTALHYIEGPELYSSADVAAAFARELNKPITVVSTSRPQWVPALQAMGFSDTAARSMANMTATTLDQQYSIPEAPVKGTTSLQEYIAGLVRANRAGASA